MPHWMADFFLKKLESTQQTAGGMKHMEWPSSPAFTFQDAAGLLLRLWGLCLLHTHIMTLTEMCFHWWKTVIVYGLLGFIYFNVLPPMLLLERMEGQGITITTIIILNKVCFYKGFFLL